MRNSRLIRRRRVGSGAPDSVETRLAEHLTEEEEALERRLEKRLTERLEAAEDDMMGLKTSRASTTTSHRAPIPSHAASDLST